MREFKFGDRVVCALNGYGVVVSIGTSRDYPVIVSFENDTYFEAYTYDGKEREKHIRQCLFHADDCPDWAKPPVKLEIDDIILVEGIPRHFAGWNGGQAMYFVLRGSSYTNDGEEPRVAPIYRVPSANKLEQLRYRPLTP